MEQKRARIKYYPEYYIGDSVKAVNGYAIELWDNTENNWELCLFVQFKDKEFLHYSFVQMIGTIYERGYELEWKI